MECSHEGILINELVGIYTSSLLPRTQLAAAHALYLALDRCRDMVHVTNDKNIVQVSWVTIEYYSFTLFTAILNISILMNQNKKKKITHVYCGKHCTISFRHFYLIDYENIDISFISKSVDCNFTLFLVSK